MGTNMTRRTFLETASAGMATVAAIGRTGYGAVGDAVGPGAGFSKTRVLRLYLGKSPSWPRPDLDLDAEMKRIQQEFDKVPGLEDVEFVGNVLVRDVNKLSTILQQFKNVDGILAVHICLGTSEMINLLADSGIPTVVFAIPYSGHEWCIVPKLQRAGKKIDVIPTSDFGEIAAAIRPLRAIHRLKETKVLYLGGGRPTCDEFRAEVKNRLRVEIKPIEPKLLLDAYEAMDAAAVEAEADTWIKRAEKIKEPSREEIVKSSRLCLALQKVLADERAHVVTINCLGMFHQKQLPAYPCLAFSKLNDMGMAGVCEADLASTLTQIIYQHMEGRPGFVSDPVIDTSNNTVIHAHCVSATKMDGPDGPDAPYVIRSHMEDNKGACLQVKMRVGQEITMAKLVSSEPHPAGKPQLAATPYASFGTRAMLVSTGQIIGIPETDRGCRTKIVTKVRDARKMLEGWSHGLHRVIFYGNFLADTHRLARFLDFDVITEG